MYFGLSEEQKSLEENITKFLSDNAPLDTIKAVATLAFEELEKFRSKNKS